MVITLQFILNFPSYNVLLTSAYVGNNGIYLSACLGSSIFSATNLQSLLCVILIFVNISYFWDEDHMCLKFSVQEGLCCQSWHFDSIRCAMQCINLIWISEGHTFIGFCFAKFFVVGEIYSRRCGVQACPSHFYGWEVKLLYTH